MSMSPFYWESRTEPSNPCILLVLSRGKAHLSLLLAMFFLMDSNLLLAFLAAKAFCWLIFNLFFQQNPQVLFSKAVFQAVSSQSTLAHGVIPPCMREFVFCLFFSILCGPFLQSVEVPLCGSAAIFCISHPSQFCIAYCLAEIALCPVI